MQKKCYSEGSDEAFPIGSSGQKSPGILLYFFWRFLLLCRRNDEVLYPERVKYN